MNKKHALAGMALIGAGLAESLAVGAPCPLCVASVGSGLYALKQSLGIGGGLP